MKLDLKKIVHTKWYRQRTDSIVYFILGPLIGVQQQLKKDVEIVLELHKDSAEFYFEEQKFFNLAKGILIKYRKNHDYLLKTYRKWRKISDQLNTTADKVMQIELDRLSNTDLLSINKKLGLLAKRIWLQPIFMDIFDPNADLLITDELKKYQLRIKPEELKVLLQPYKPLAAQNYRLALLSLIGNNNKDYSKIIKYFYYINCSYAESPQLTVKQIQGELRDLSKNPHYIAERKKLETYEKDFQKRIMEVHKKYKMSAWLKDFFYFFSCLAVWRDERKTSMQKSFYALGLLGNEIAKRSRISWNKLNLCPPYEINKIPVPVNLINKYLVLLKQNHFFIYNSKKERFVPYDKKYTQKLRKALNSHPSDIKEILGQIGCTGKIFGKVKIIHGEKDFPKFQKGEVLVTAMTRPEFLPLMKKSKAIITDEGGITSHAAIVSRELNIPCIIGTRVASKLLKDGDLVEVNANHGIVKKLK